MALEGELPRSSLNNGSRESHHDIAVTDPIVKRVAIGIPLKGHTPPESYHDRMILASYMGSKEAEDRYLNASPRYEFLWFSAGEIFIPFAREQFADAALRYNCDYLFMIDDDMLSEPDLFYKLVKHNVDIVAPLAFMRNPPHFPVIYSIEEGYSPSVDGEYCFTHYVKNYPRNKLVECDAVGFGAVLIKTRVFKAMKPPFFMGSHGTGEDIHFCIQARKFGFSVFMDTATKLTHLSHPTKVSEEYVDSFNKMSEEERDRVYGQFEKYPSRDLVKAR